ncbi:MAG: cytochrome c [Elusimicrobia bacterium]|jgi:mono/diheme cytochrome c family protein|nr:cytochrome c [Elusimicrobiota bacterium]MBK7544854.1 cytochrome c [Elusimicrobiota bacterium]MBK7574366.1 cytochrome c [Elusimicrobiota bacterium]MBK8126512.1 cytochrome c [Elusimicrobiota bacterium]MBK9056266.1 cytochrome c [Elusimicrobiota bacterium]
MRRALWILIPFALSACAPSKDPAARGAARFAALGCVTCHRVGERGGGQAGPDLTTVGIRHSAAWLDLWLKDPSAWKLGTTMPNLKLKDDVRADLVAYLQSLNGEPYRATRPWNAPGVKADPRKRGEMIYNRVGCVACHGDRGRGGFPNNNVVGSAVPGLKHARDGFSVPELKERIRLGRRPEPADPTRPPPWVEMPGWKDFLSEDELDALVTYLHSLAPPKADDWAE